MNVSEQREGLYHCSGENSVPNLINSPERATVEVFVQGSQYNYNNYILFMFHHQFIRIKAVILEGTCYNDNNKLYKKMKFSIAVTKVYHGIAKFL